MAVNSTICPVFSDNDPLCFHPVSHPFYYSTKVQLVQGIPDHILTLAAPIIAYWSLSLFFHFLDISKWKWLEKYRIHESAEVQAKNLATRTEVVWAVIFQHIVQTALGLLWLSDGGPQVVDHGVRMRNIAVLLQPLITPFMGEHLAQAVLPDVAYFVYWWGVPSIQFLAAIFWIDTWQYFLHRAMHVNKFLYKQFHSWHHRLYVPYAFGSLYNHPVEGFLLDSLGAAIAEWLTGLTNRQAMVLFVVSTLKTVDDHCGYSLPFDPLQLVTGNNADYHDIHHQVIGIKSNFAQPFFIHWDVVLGTRMTRQEIEQRKEKYGKNK
ncbi:sphingosine hydroxylase [Cyathus striatus]|nr:sphingosine hydroxylase [Cyathus striatus]